MSTTGDLFQVGKLDEGISALRRDLLAEGGPQISTMRSYQFAILPYPPKNEFELRRKIRILSDELRAQDWAVLPIALHKVFLDRVRRQEAGFADSVIAREKSLYRREPARGLNHFEDKLAELITEPDGIAVDVAAIVHDFITAHPSHASRTVVIVGRAGALFPLFRMSALLKHIAGKTKNIPVVLLYPGERTGPNSLSSMGELKPDGDYRPRIYP